MNFYDIDVTTIDGHDLKLDTYRGRVLLIVNVASKCAFTGQYAGLESLYRRYKDNGLVVLGFPCNQFGQQEPGDEVAIKSFCSTTYDVSFPLFKKIAVNGSATHLLYQYLKAERPGSLWTKSIKWNFTKFLIGRDGKVIGRYGPTSTPSRLEGDIVAALAAN